MRDIKKIVLLSLGWISLILGMLGILLPVMPTTPFLILAAFLFSRSSKRFHHWLIKHRLFGPPLRDWLEQRAVRPRAKLAAAILILISYVSILFFLSLELTWSILLGFGFGFVLLFILTRPHPHTNSDCH